ncbi:hypothetical protein AZOA_47920 [Azoarcus sp. Aa7]|nr:hypothetical protein [Azoarcus sp. Aa7]
MTAITLPNLSVRALSRLTRLDRDRLSRALGDAKPAGMRGGHPVYALADVLPLLCRPGIADAAGEIDADRLAPTDRRAWYDSEAKRRELQVRDRELIPATEVGQVIATAFANIASELRAIADNLERQGEATPDQAARIERRIDVALDVLADRLSGLAPDVSNGRKSD